MDIINWEELSSQERIACLKRPAVDSADSVQAIVSDIIKAITERGDEALVEFAKKFDKCPDGNLKLTQDEIQAACERIDPALKQAIDDAYINIKKFHAAQEPCHVKVETVDGVVCQTATHAIEKVGLYVPGGSAPLVSTALMLGVPAQIANCEQVVLTSPYPLSDGIIYAACKCGIKDIFKVGGAHAIAALAYGTDTVPKVHKIFGPGNQFVTMAKRLVSEDPNGAAIDMPAGPSEVLVIADAQADADFVAADLLSQAEHGPDSQVILVSESSDLLERTQKALDEQLQLLPRKDIALKALSKSRLIKTKDLQEAIEISNTYAPEHLIVQIADPHAIVDKLRNAGSIFLGSYTCESMGDYASGTNHTLPTYGYAKTASALGTDDFRRRYTISCASAQGLRNIGPTVEILAAAEGLDGHKNAVTIRLNKIGRNSDQNSCNKQDWRIKVVDLTKLACEHVQKLEPYQSARRIGGHGHTFLNANESPKSEFYIFNSTTLNRYPDCQPFEVTQGMADYVGLQRDQVLVSRGSDEAIGLLIRTFCEIGEGIVIAPPTYGMYEIAANTNRAKTHYAKRNDDFTLSATAIAQAINEAPFKVKLVFIDSPANPLGILFDKDELVTLLKQFPEVLFVLDEAYIEYAPEHTCVPLLKDYPNLVITRTLSKAFALAGIRCGFTLAHSDIIALMTKVIDPYPIADPVAQIARQALARGGIELMQERVNKCLELRASLIKNLEALPIVKRVHPTEANFVLAEFVDGPAVFEAMVQKGIILRSFETKPGLKNNIRITVGTPEELDEVMRVLTAIAGS